MHTLLDIESFNQLAGHPVYGSSWESYVFSQLSSALRRWKFYFYRTARGDEIDLLLQRGERLIAIECKASAAPNVSAGFYRSLDDLKIDFGYVVAPVKEEESYQLGERAQVVSPEKLIEIVNSF